uniref:Uncharacterized protein n=1 Tax=Labrus bergylta TaxID=56723 RepID=A0A3Q3E3V8_9LABR
MEAPEYLDLDEIDFSDDSYSVTSLKSIPELSRRSDGQAEERPGSYGRQWAEGFGGAGGRWTRRQRRIKTSSTSSERDRSRCW